MGQISRRTRDEAIRIVAIADRSEHATRERLLGRSDAVTIDIPSARAICDAATPAIGWSSQVWFGNDEGGWAAIGPHHETDDEAKEDQDEPGSETYKMAERDSAFILAARTGWPEALDRIALLEAQVERLRVLVPVSVSDAAQVVAVLHGQLDDATGQLDPLVGRVALLERLLGARRASSASPARRTHASTERPRTDSTRSSATEQK